MLQPIDVCKTRLQLDKSGKYKGEAPLQAVNLITSIDASARKGGGRSWAMAVCSRTLGEDG